MKNHKGGKARRELWPFFALSPVVIVIIVLMLFPVLNLFYLALHREEWSDGQLQRIFVGFSNIELFWRDQFYWKGLYNTVVFSVTVVLALTAVGLRYGRTIFIGIVLLPLILPPIIIGAIWRLILNLDLGFLNTLLAFVGVQGPNWLGVPSLAFMSVIFVDVWHWTPFAFLLLLAGLEALPDETLEAAELDGAGSLQRLRYVILPLMWPTFVVTILFRIILSFKVFDEIYLLTRGGPGTATEVISYSIYRAFFAQGQTGLGSVMSLFTIFTIATIALILLRLRRKAVNS